MTGLAAEKALRDLAQTGVFGQHLVCIAAVALHVAGSDIELQPRVERTGALDALLQHLDAHAQVGERIERGEFAAEVFVLGAVHASHNLHQALGAYRALGEWIESRFHRHDSEDQGRVKFGFLADFVGFDDQCTQGLRRDAVFLAEPVGHRGLLLGQVPGIDRCGAIDRVQLRFHPERGGLARLQPAHESGFAGLAKVGAGGEGDDRKHHSQADKGKAVVRDFKKALGNIGRESSQALGRLS